MKLIFKKSFIILHVIIFLFASCKKEVVLTDYQYLIENPKGKVKTVKINCYSAKDKFGKIVKGRPDEFDDIFDEEMDDLIINTNLNVKLNSNAYRFSFSHDKSIFNIILRFDDNGNLIEKEGYGRNGEIIEKKLISWKDSDKFLGIKTYDENGELSKQISIKYDDDGNWIKYYDSEYLIRYRSYNKNHILIDSTIYLKEEDIEVYVYNYFDEKNKHYREIKKKNSQNKLILYSIAEIDKKDKPIIETYYDQNGNIKTIYKFYKQKGRFYKEVKKNTESGLKISSISELNKNEDPIIETYFDKNEEISKVHKYEYFFKDLVSKEMELDNDGNIERKEEIVIDEKGRIIELLSSYNDSYYNNYYTYDKNGFIEKKTYKSKNRQDETFYSYELDDKGNITRLIINWGDEGEYYDLVECEYEYYE